MTDIPSAPPAAPRRALPVPPGPADVQPLLDAVLHLGERGHDAVALETRASEGWRSLRYSDLRRRSASLAAALHERGVGPGDKVALLGEPGDAWVTGLFGVLRAGAVALPLDRSLSVDDLHQIVRHAGPVVALVAPAYAGQVETWRESAPTLASVMELSDSALAALPVSTDGPIPSDGTRGDSDIALLVYTSGTTGRPKGVQLTYANLTHQVRSLVSTQRLGSDNVFLSILPLSHALELTCGLMAPLAIGARVCYSPTLHPHELAVLMREKQVTRMVVVPLFLRMLKKSIEAQTRARPAVVGHGFALAHLAAARIPSRLLRRTMFTMVHREIGGHLMTFFCGGAPLDEDVAAFFGRMGIGVMQGYGLTETSPVSVMNTPAARRRRSVGRAMPGVTIAIGDGEHGAVGEVLVKGPCVMAGYLNDPVQTDEAIDQQGWLHTGDLGNLDAEGFLYVTGRAKSLIVLESGKKVQPEEVEQAIEGGHLVAEVCVLGHRGRGRVVGGAAEQVYAVVTASDEAKRRHPDRTELQQALAAEVAGRVAGLAPFKRPGSVVAHPGELPKSTTRKVLRNRVATWLADQEVLAS